MNARAFYQRFHWGRPSTKRTRVVLPPGAPSKLVGLGAVTALVVDRDGERITITPPDGSQLTTSASGSGLYIVHPTHRVTIGDAAEGVFGELLRVDYVTRKGSDEPATYRHGFHRPRPVLAIRQGHAVIEGGAFHTTWRGIIN